MTEEQDVNIRAKAVELALQLHGRHASASDLVKAAAIIEDFIRGREKR